MPIYEYAPTSGHCDQCGGRFEVMQRVADAKLAACPTCGQPCTRRISAVALGGTYSVSDDKIKNSGLTKYKKAGDGIYERTAGTGGPEVIVRK
ncbi:MAG: FmdB family zinc ribbon protein [Burkholderiales bacterium]